MGFFRTDMVISYIYLRPLRHKSELQTQKGLATGTTLQRQRPALRTTYNKQGMEKDKDKRTTDIIPDGITNGGIAASIKGGSPTGNTSVSLGTRSLERWLSEAKVMYSGMIMICRTGSASIRVNFSMWKLSAGSVLTLFPNDMVTLTDRSEDFSVEVLEYNATLLREASLQMEQTVYSQ